MTEPELTLSDSAPLRPDLQALRITLDTQEVGRKQSRIVSIAGAVCVAIVLVLLAWGWGLKPILLASVVVVFFGWLYWQLYRQVRRRHVSEYLVLLGFSPLTILPALLYVLMRPAKTGAATQNQLDVSILDNKGLLWSVALLSWLPFPPFMMNLIAYFAMLPIPKRLDMNGVEMRRLPLLKGKRYLWSECRSCSASQTEMRGVLTRGQLNRELQLNFREGEVTIKTAPTRDSPAYTFTLRMLEHFDIPLE